MAIKANIIIDQGTDFTATVDVTTTEGGVFDLSNHTASAMMRKNYAQSSATATFTCTDNGVNGQITMSLTNVQTSAIEPGRYLYDVEITKTNDDPVTITRVVEGTVTVTPGMTR